MVTHATVWAIQWIVRDEVDFDAVVSWPSAIQACDWTRTTRGEDLTFAEESAAALVKGKASKDPLPTCPECAVLVDLALEAQ